ncbi:MAG: hypothetical protein H6556_09850 [Lewinellaceae bacterium]|nr:hypothetical protein [Lewinellaceae bacterium]
MSREIKKDFDHFVAFLKNYNLKKLFDDDQIINDLSRVHKKYFSYLSLISELDQYKNDDTYDIPLRTDQFSYLAESSSDIGSAIFHSVNGSYKSSRMLLRSSIETFFKGFCFDEIEDILEEKRVFVIFDKIKELNYFKNEAQRSQFEICHVEYADLCKDVHTAEEINMQKLTALKYFPSYDPEKMNSICERILKITPAFLFLLCNKFNQQFQKMHHRNKENILHSIKKKLRPTILANINLDE